MTEQELSDCEAAAQDTALIIDNKMESMTSEQKRYFLQRIKTHYDNSLTELNG